MPHVPTLAIVGGGALGAALVGALVDKITPSVSARTTPRVVLFEKEAHVGRGVAYAKDVASYLLNTTAQTMSLVPGRRSHFFEWLGERGLAPNEPGDHFCPRERFGDYVEDCFVRAVDEARRRGVVVTTVRDEVTALGARAGGGYRIGTRGGVQLDADVAVLAVGNLPSRRYRELAGPGFFTSPYPSEALRAAIPAGARVGILGTGLSAIDAALALFAAGHQGPVTMASRSGLLPAVRGPLVEHELVHVTRANVARITERGRRPLRWATVLRWLEQEVGRAGGAICWDDDFPAWAPPQQHLAREIAAAERGPRVSQAIGEALNPMMDLLWHHLAEEDRQLFLERFRSRFMSHWVPIPLVTARRMLGPLQQERLRVARGLCAVTRAGGGYRLALGAHSAEVDVVIHATGAPRHLHETESPLLRALERQGTIVAHPCGGARVEFESLRVIGADGRPDPGLYALGNLTCGTHLFTSTLDLNVEKADRVATRVAEALHRRTEKDRHVDSTSHST